MNALFIFFCIDCCCVSGELTLWFPQQMVGSILVKLSRKKSSSLNNSRRKVCVFSFCFLVIAKWLPWDLYVGFTTQIKYFKLSKVSAI